MRFPALAFLAGLLLLSATAPALAQTVPIVWERGPLILSPADPTADIREKAVVVCGPDVCETYYTIQPAGSGESDPSHIHMALSKDPLRPAAIYGTVNPILGRVEIDQDMSVLRRADGSFDMLVEVHDPAGGNYRIEWFESAPGDGVKFTKVEGWSIPVAASPVLFETATGFGLFYEEMNLDGTPFGMRLKLAADIAGLPAAPVQVVEEHPTIETVPDSVLWDGVKWSLFFHGRLSSGVYPAFVMTSPDLASWSPWQRMFPNDDRLSTPFAFWHDSDGDGTPEAYAYVWEINGGDRNIYLAGEEQAAPPPPPPGTGEFVWWLDDVPITEFPFGDPVITADAAGNPNALMVCDGVDDYIETGITGDLFADAFTAMAYVEFPVAARSDQWSGPVYLEHTFAMIRDNENAAWENGVAVHRGPWYLAPSNGIPTGTRVRWTVTWDGQTVRNYINGVQQSATQLPGAGPLEFGPEPLMFCRHSPAFPSYQEGIVETVKIWTRALTPAEIAAEM